MLTGPTTEVAIPVMTDDEAASYDEFSMLKIYADYDGLPWTGPPTVERRSYAVAPGQRVSALAWGNGEPELLLLHGGGQNAHSWDSTAMALGRPLLAAELPGHGHSDWRDDRDYSPQSNAAAIAEVLGQSVTRPLSVVGMSLGGLSTMQLAARWPTLVDRVVIVDVSPSAAERAQSMTMQQRGAVALMSGPTSFPSFDAILQAAGAASPGRDLETLRPGVLHNARRRDDGTWGWRYDSFRPEGNPVGDPSTLWEDFAAITAPIMLVRGGRSMFVHDDDEARMQALQPTMRAESVEGAGHSVQSERPLVLAGLISDFLAEDG
jgi:pimeloyl-ACP methyl ester carboxylesterase